MIERKDKVKNKAKITKEILNDPLKTQREIAKDAWVWLWTVNRTVKELEQTGTKDPRIIGICDTDLDIVTLWQEELLRRLQEAPDKMSTRDIVSTMDTWTKRYTIFKWDITDSEWWMKNTITEEQRQALIERFKIDG